MNRPTKSALFLMIVSSVLSFEALANMSYSPWVHEIVQNGADMEVTVAIFEETTATNVDGDPLPGFEVAYTLERWIEHKSVPIFENRVFKPEEADEVTAYSCQRWYGEWDEPNCSATQCEDCDGDGVEECDGFCAVAYRYKVIDECPPPGENLYFMFTDPPRYWYEEGEGLGFTTTATEDIGAACQEDSGCSVSGVSISSQGVSLLRAVLDLTFE